MVLSDSRLYLLSLPERAVRSVSAVSAGLLRELGDAVLPLSVRRTRLYRNMVTSTLRFLIEQVGEVEDAFPDEGRLSKDFALRRAAGNGIEFLGILAFRASPVWVLAALADLSGTGRQLIREIASCLEDEGLLPEDTEYRSVDQLLDGLEETSARMAEAVNTPPLDVATLRKEWQALRRSVARIPPENLPAPGRLLDMWREMRQAARDQGRSVFQLSSLLALSALEDLPARLRWLSRSAVHAARRTGVFLAEPLLDHYSATLNEIRARGFLPYWTDKFRPYLRAAATQFSRQRSSMTQRLLKGRET